MASALTRSFLPDLDFILEQAIADLQLTPTQYKKAVEHYEAVGRYLEHPRSPLARLRPTIYPQGSMALQTTIRPIAQQEHDLDLVSQTLPCGQSPMWLYETTYDWLEQNDQYRPILQRYKRCIRLSYAGNFHLDVVPAEPDGIRPIPCIQVPDRKIVDWTTSNPLGYIAWFKLRSAVRLREGVRATAPMPAQESPDEKSPLAIAVQVIKRRRDWAFRDDAANAPRSVALTTLAGSFYSGQSSVIECVHAILVAIEEAIAAAAPNRLVVVNPTNPAECFSESFTDISYQKFVSFVHDFRSELDEILSVVGGIPALRGHLANMFGDAPADRAVKAWGDRLQRQRGGELRFGAASGIAVVTEQPDTSHRVPRNNFYGG